MKTVLQITALNLIFIAILISIPGREGRVAFSIENLWTARLDEIDSHHLRYVRFRSLNAPKPDETVSRTPPDFFEGIRWHFGFPCRYLVVDSGIRKNTGEHIWYAKLDIHRIFVNGITGILISFCVLRGYYRFRPKKYRHKQQISINPPA
ncbi:MAG: hypothetical protein WC496_03015 [Phycisphaerae bacterium]